MLNNYRLSTAAVYPEDSASAVDVDEPPEEEEYEQEYEQSYRGCCGKFCKSLFFTNLVLLLTLIVVVIVVLSVTWGSSFGENMTKMINLSRISLFTNLFYFAQSHFESSIMMMNANFAQVDLKLVDLTNLDSALPYVVSTFVNANLTTYSGFNRGPWPDMYCATADNNVLVIEYNTDSPTTVCIGVSWRGLNDNSYYYGPIDPYTFAYNISDFSEPVSSVNDFDYSGEPEDLVTARDSPHQPRYTRSYMDPNFGTSVYITYVRAYHDENGTFIAYCGTDQFFDTMTELLSSLIGDTGGHIYVIERDSAFLLGSSSGDPLVIHANDTTYRVNTTNSEIPFFNSVISTMMQKYGSGFEQVGHQVPILDQTIINGEIHYITMQNYLHEQAHLDWLLIQTIPATYFTREIITAGSVAGSLSVFLLGIGAISGFIAMRLFFRPLIRLMDQLRQVQDMDLDVRFYNSYFTEVNQLERAFEDLVKRLKEYRNFLPDHLLNGKDDESSESATVAESKTEAEIMLTKNSAGSVHHSLDNQSTRSATGVKKNRMFAIGVEKKPVSIVTVRMTNIAKLLSGQDVSRETIISQLGQVIDAVHKIAKTSGGQVSRFDPEFIELVWNGMRSERNHVLFACNAASRIYKRISELTQHFDFCLEPRVFVSSGNAYVGNIGCSSLRQFTVIGEPTETIQGMNGLNDWGASVLIDGKLASHVKQKYQVRPVQPILLHESNFLQEPIHIYELGSSIEIKDDEWMYEMEEAKANSRWEEYTDAYDKFVAGNYNIAKHELMQYVENYGTDNLAERMITLCESYNGQSKGSLLRTVYTLQSQDKIQEI